MRIGCEQNPATHALRDDGVGGGGGGGGGRGSAGCEDF